jgi:hypothetical protein
VRRATTASTVGLAYSQDPDGTTAYPISLAEDATTFLGHADATQDTADIASDPDDVPERSKSFLLVGGSLAAIFIAGMMALTVALVVNVRPTADQGSDDMAMHPGAAAPPPALQDAPPEAAQKQLPKPVPPPAPAAPPPARIAVAQLMELPAPPPQVVVRNAGPAPAAPPLAPPPPPPLVLPPGIPPLVINWLPPIVPPPPFFNPGLRGPGFGHGNGHGRGHGHGGGD